MQIYTDGSCEPNPGDGGWAFVVKATGYWQAGAERDTTNNRMELTAIVQAVKYVPEGGTATIVTDSQLCANVLSGKWRGKSNTDLITAVRLASRNKRIWYRWVRGHNGSRLNEEADRRAGEARESLKWEFVHG